MKTELIEKIEDLLDINMIKGVPFHDNLVYTHVGFFTIQILSQDSFLKKQILKTFESEEELYPDLVSSLENPNCSCKKRVINFLSKNFLSVFDKLKTIFLYDECGNDKLTKIYGFLSSNVNNANNKISNQNENLNSVKIAESKIENENLDSVKTTESKIESVQQDLAPKKLPNNIGINYVEIMNMLPNIKSISGKFVTIAVWHYEPLFNAIKMTECKYEGVSIHKEGNVLHLFFF